MLKISQNQLLKISTKKMGDFQKRLKGRLIKDFGSAPYNRSTEEIRLSSEKAWHAAKVHGMKTESEYVRHSYIMVSLDFEGNPNPDREWIERVFQSRRTAPEKLLLCENALTEGAG